MHLFLFRIFLTIVIMNCLVRPSQQVKRCGCSQCLHISEGVRRCECCVYMLHGKRSLNKRVIHALETTETKNNIDVFALEKRRTPDFLSEESYNLPLTERIMNNYLYDGSSSYNPKEPFGVNIRDSFNDGDVFKGTWQRILGYVNEKDKTEDTYLYLV